MSTISLGKSITGVGHSVLGRDWGKSEINKAKRRGHSGSPWGVPRLVVKDEESTALDFMR